MNYPAAELRGIKMNFYLINPDAEHRGILLIKEWIFWSRTPVSNFNLSSYKTACDIHLWFMTEFGS
jgi:hypothetical protein